VALQLFAQLTCLSLLGITTFLPSVQAEEKTAPIAVSDGKTISIEYTLALDDKKVLDINVGGKPLDFTQGSHQIIPGLETALERMKVGESKHVTVVSEQGYGPINPQAM